METISPGLCLCQARIQRGRATRFETLPEKSAQKFLGLLLCCTVGNVQLKNVIVDVINIIVTITVGVKCAPECIKLHHHFDGENIMPPLCPIHHPLWRGILPPQTLSLRRPHFNTVHTGWAKKLHPPLHILIHHISAVIQDKMKRISPKYSQSLRKSRLSRSFYAAAKYSLPICSILLYPKSYFQWNSCHLMCTLDI